MLKTLVIQNFKSIEQVKIEFDQFNCLIGLNGAGKTTLLQAIDFTTQVLTGQVKPWLEERGWVAQDLSCQLGRGHIGQLIVMNAKFQCSTGLIVWYGSFNRNLMHCMVENVFLDGKPILETKKDHYRIGDQPWKAIDFMFTGSLLSQLKRSELPQPVVEFLDAMGRVRALDLLSPQLMRKRARSSDRDIGSGGEKLSAFLYEVKGEARVRLIDLLRGFYPQLVDFKVNNMRAGWKKLSIIEQFGNKQLVTEALHLSDGLLRILAILAQADSDRSLLLLDEIENGINPEIVEKLVATLSTIPRQVIFTTHSPMILNVMDDELAQRSVVFVYKSPTGDTRCRRFFDIPRIAEKLHLMGPGEVFADTSLVALTKECLDLDSQPSQAAG